MDKSSGAVRHDKVVRMDEQAKRDCPDCGAKAGHLHKDGCDVERCPECGGQMQSCGCDVQANGKRLPWSGEWPGDMACREFGWYAKFVPGQGWQPCSKDDPQARPDINRLVSEAVWSKEQGRFVLSGDAGGQGGSSGTGE